jgi:hypothetical protein
MLGLTRHPAFLGTRRSRIPAFAGMTTDCYWKGRLRLCQYQDANVTMNANIAMIKAR